MGAPTRLSQTEVYSLTAEFPDLPADYLAYLVDIGWGESASGNMIYSGPIFPDEIFGTEINLEHLNNVVLLGDDFQGSCLGFNLVTKQYGEVVDDRTWEPWPPNHGIAEYVNHA